MAGTAEEGDGDRRPPIRPPPMGVPKAASVLAAELRERILGGEFPEGSALPVERELMSQTRLSRTAVREALRILEVQGLVRTKAGRAGGSFARKPGEESVAGAVALLIRGRRIPLAAVLQTREAIEPSCAHLAAAKREDRDVEALTVAYAAMAGSHELDAFLQANLDWHIGVATAAHNEILAGMMIALSRAIYTPAHNQGFTDPAVRALTVRVHRGITEAIRERDPEAAARRMFRHVHAWAEAAHDVAT